MADWFVASPQSLFAAAASAVCTLAAIIVYTRIVGLRSFAKLSAFDFASTVAIGSILGSAAVSKSVPVAVAASALAMLYVCSWLIAVLRQRFGFRLVDNEPLLLIRDRTVIMPALRRARLTLDDLRAKLREANVLRVDTIQAVVLETTGDFNVLSGDGPIDARLLADVTDLSDQLTRETEDQFLGLTCRE